MARAPSIAPQAKPSDRFLLSREDVIPMNPGEVYTPPPVPDYVGDGTLDENFEFRQEELDVIAAENAENTADDTVE